MRNAIRTFTITTILGLVATVPLRAQQETRADPGIMAAQMSSGMLKAWLTAAAEQMNEADYAFRATPDVRSFGQILAHVADSDYEFCAAANGETPAVRHSETNLTTRTEIRKVLADAFAYCDAVYAGLTPAKASALVELRGSPLPALAVLIFRTNHASLHYGNVITYMRLRGKVPPSSGMPR